MVYRLSTSKKRKPSFFGGPHVSMSQKGPALRHSHLPGLVQTGASLVLLLSKLLSAFLERLRIQSFYPQLSWGRWSKHIVGVCVLRLMFCLFACLFV